MVNESFLFYFKIGMKFTCVNHLLQREQEINDNLVKIYITHEFKENTIKPFLVEKANAIKPLNE
jgi:hypothetical protein